MGSGGRLVIEVPRAKRGIFHQLNNMHVGVCRVSLRLPENLSLKGKRQVLKSIKTQTRNRFDIAIAEVDDHELWQIATLGVCCIGNDSRYVNEILSKVVNFIDGGCFSIELLDYNIEMIPC